MPLGDFDREVLRLLAANRNPDSFVAGVTVLHQSPDSPRSSRDVDLFHDTLESLSRSVERDVVTLRAAGYEVELGRAQDTFQRARVRANQREAKVEWPRRNALYREDSLNDLLLSHPPALTELKQRWMEASQDALNLIVRLPPDELGCLYLDAAGEPVCPDPTEPGFTQLTRHYGSVKGAWPRIVEESVDG